MPWTDEDVRIGEILLAEEKKIDRNVIGSWALRMNMAATKLKYTSYNDKSLEGVKEYIKFKGGEAKRVKALIAAEAKKRRMQDELDSRQESMSESAWFKELLENPNMVHGLHPEDDALLLKQIQNGEI